MKAWVRNQLVWITPAAWQTIENQAWDAQAQSLLAHWRTQQWPLVVCRQRAELAPGQISLGLPAPLAWSRRRLGLNVSADQINAEGRFPSLSEVAQKHPWARAGQALEARLQQLGVQSQVYGSHGWQWLTSLPYLHASSDLSLPVDSPATARSVARCLAKAPDLPRLDGELVFPDGSAVAWREWLKHQDGQTAQVLVKDRHHAWLTTFA